VLTIASVGDRSSAAKSADQTRRTSAYLLAAPAPLRRFNHLKADVMQVVCRPSGRRPVHRLGLRLGNTETMIDGQVRVYMCSECIAYRRDYVHVDKT